MIVKTHGSKQANFAVKIEYFVQDHGKVQTLEETFSIFQHIRDTTFEGVIQAFQENDLYRSKNALQKKIKSSVVYYHDKISFSPEDKKVLTQDILRDLTEKYLELRAPHAVAFAKPHLHNRNLHVHVMISGTDYKSYQVTRLDNQNFVRVRQELEKYQKEKYPFIEHSLVYEEMSMNPKNKRRNKAKDDERKLRERQDVILDKDLLIKAVNDFYLISESKAHFYELVKQHGIELYSRKFRAGERVVGIECNKRKFRFSSLGMDETKLNEIEKRHEKQAAGQKANENEDILKKYSRYRVTREDGQSQSKYRTERTKGKDKDLEIDL